VTRLLEIRGPVLGQLGVPKWRISRDRAGLGGMS
jgi:hypothetical protein